MWSRVAVIFLILVLVCFSIWKLFFSDEVQTQQDTTINLPSEADRPRIGRNGNQTVKEDPYVDEISEKIDILYKDRLGE